MTSKPTSVLLALRVIVFCVPAAACWILWGVMWWVVSDAFINGSLLAGIVASLITLMVGFGPIAISTVTVQTLRGTT